MTDTNNNGAVALPESRKAAVEQAALYYQEMSARNDELTAEVVQLKTELAGYKISLEVMTAQRNEAESKAETAMLTVKQHEAARIEYESLFASCQSLFDTFRVPHKPMVRALADQVADRENQ